MSLAQIAMSTVLLVWHVRSAAMVDVGVSGEIIMMFFG
jgi:hypothetical protein